MALNYVTREMNHSAHDDHMDHSAHGEMDMGGMNHSDHAMSPYLFANAKDFFLLFREARISSGGGLALAIVVSVVFTILATMFSLYAKTVERKSESEEKRLSGNLVFATVMYAFRLFLHYITMLLAMSMNLWILLAVTTGHALGYYIYGVAFFGTKIANRTEACDSC